MSESTRAVDAGQQALGSISAISLFVEDVPATKAFYEDVFGVETVFEDESSACVRFDGCSSTCSTSRLRRSRSIESRTVRPAHGSS